MTDGSKPLDPKREKFIKFLLLGDSAAKAYQKVYPKAGAARCETAGPAMKRESQVKVRFLWMQKGVEKKTLLTIEEKREFLALAVRTPIAEIDENHPLCQSIEYQVNGGIRGQLRRGNYESGNEDEIPETTTVKIKAVDKLSAIKIDNEMDPNFDPKKQVVEHTGGVEITIQQIFTLVNGGKPNAS